MALSTCWDLDRIRTTLVSKDANIVDRMMALFYARWHDNEDAAKTLELGLWHPSVLLRHEIAYVLGQMGQRFSIPILIKLCDDVNEHEMVRHEAGEALNALGCTDDDVFACVERHLNDPCNPVRETFELAYIGLQRKRDRSAKCGTSNAKKRADPTKGFYIFTASARADGEGGDDKSSAPKEFQTTRDPADGDKSRQKPEEITALGETLANEKAALWDRYVAMFTLRNINTNEAAAALAAALSEKSSALLRHEICFVLGQMQLPVCVEQLIQRVEDLQEASMARHEAALALGSVGADIWSAKGRDTRKRCLDILEKYATDPDPIVAESCVVALHNIEWETGTSNSDRRN